MSSPSSASAAWAKSIRATDTRLQRDVALKVLPAAMSADPARIERFKREARAVAALNHPNIVTIHSVEEADGVHFLTMELVEGRTLDDVLAGNRLSLEQFLAIAVPLADAVAAAHAARITHRDLKPQNVMFGRDGRLKVLDFGLAKFGETGTEVEQLLGGTTMVRTAGGDDRRHRPLHVARAGRGPRRGRTKRRVLTRRDVLRNGDRPTAVRRRERAGEMRRHPARHASPDRDAGASVPGCAVRGHRSQSGEESGRALSGCRRAP